MWGRYSELLNSSFYFVIDKCFDLMEFFMKQAYAFGRLVLLIALLTAGLNYALTRTGLQENLVKILKAVLFFYIVMAGYPRIIGWISNYTFLMAQGSIYESVRAHFEGVTREVESSYEISVPTGVRPYEEFSFATQSNSMYRTVIARQKHIIKENDNFNLFDELTEVRPHKKTGMSYTVVRPSAVLKIIFFLADECFHYAEEKDAAFLSFPNMTRIVKGCICAFFLIFTGVFALLEYIVCFLEFALVVSVGIILFPMSIWEGSKFLTEGFIKSIIGFFMKLLFCNIAIFLLLYGFISIFYTMVGKSTTGGDTAAFTGGVDQIILIVFSSFLFFLVCKAAPGLAGSLLSGSPSLNASGAISAAAGAVGAVGAMAALPAAAKSKIAGVAGAAGAVVGGIAKTAGVLSEAGAAAKAARTAHGTKAEQAGAFMASLGRQTSQGLARSIHGSQSGGQTMGKLKEGRQLAGAETGAQYMNSRKGKTDEEKAKT